MYNVINPLYFSQQVKNKPYEPTGKYAFIHENTNESKEIVTLLEIFLTSALSLTMLMYVLF
jgi:hypothetical protein